MHITIPSRFKRIELPSFEEFLKQCPDYTRDGFSGCVRYQWRHNGKAFAYVTTGDGKEIVFVDPFLLE